MHCRASIPLRRPSTVFPPSLHSLASHPRYLVSHRLTPLGPRSTLTLVTAAYGVSWAYLIGDVTFTTYKAKEQGPTAWEAANFSEPTRLSMVAIKRSVFQGLASMALPAFTIHTAVAKTAQAVKNSTNVRVKRWAPTAVGIGIVPFLPYLFDHPVEYATDFLFDKVEAAMAKDGGSAKPTEPKHEL